MRDLRQAAAVLTMAHKDFKALKAMMDAEVFDEEIFGFHAQQAIEKSFKAWSAILGREYPFTHDISALLDLLSTNGQAIDQYRDLKEYNAYAVRFRCESLQTCDEPLDRRAAVASVGELISHVERMRGETPEE